MLKLLLFTTLFIVHSSASPSPGDSFKAYGSSEPINVFGDELVSTKAQWNYEYFYLNFCREGRDQLKPPQQSPTKTTQWTPYGFWTGVKRGCVHLCRREFSEEDVQKFIDLIDRDYRMNLVIDNLPMLNNQTSDIGVPLGFKEDGKYYINNHLSFVVETIEDTKVSTMNRVFSFYATPKSLQTMIIDEIPMGYCENEKSRPLDPDYQEIKPGSIFFSFDIKFFKVSKTLAERNENYKQLGSAEIHSSSLILSGALNLGLFFALRYLLQRPPSNYTKLNPVLSPEKPAAPLHESLSFLQGLLPFISIFVELKYLMISFWQHKFYYLHSYLLAAFFMMLITSALISMIVTRLNLNNGNQKLSFWNPGSVGYYVFAYAIFFYFSELDLIGFSARFIYFGYTLALCALLTLLSCAVEFIASSWLITNNPSEALDSKRK